MTRSTHTAFSIRRALAAASAAAAVATFACLPARADNSTTYDRCGSDDLKFAVGSGGQNAWLPVHYVGKSGMQSPSGLSAVASGKVVIAWSCDGSKDDTKCPEGTVGFAVTRSGQSKFRVDCYDKIGYDARLAP